MGEAREYHSYSVIGRERELRLSDIGFQLINNSGENGVREAVKGSPLSVAERSFHGPYVFG